METKYIGSLAKIENGVTTYYHVDHLGSTRQVTDSSGNALFADYLIYMPFGEIYSGSAGDERYLFNGKEKDVTGLYYYGARFYDPEVGRFITKDPIKGDIENPQSLNLYVYVLNNPLRFVDPAGMKIKKEITKEPPPASDTDNNAGGTTLNGDGEGAVGMLIGEGEYGNVKILMFWQGGNNYVIEIIVTLDDGTEITETIEINLSDRKEMGTTFEDAFEDLLGEAIGEGINIDSLVNNLKGAFKDLSSNIREMINENISLFLIANSPWFEIPIDIGNVDELFEQAIQGIIALYEILPIIMDVLENLINPTIW